MNKQVILEQAKRLSGISLSEWNYLKNVIDSFFDNKKRELESEIKLSDMNEVEKIISSRFGQKIGFMRR